MKKVLLIIGLAAGLLAGVTVAVHLISGETASADCVTC